LSSPPPVEDGGGVSRVPFVAVEVGWEVCDEVVVWLGADAGALRGWTKTAKARIPPTARRAAKEITESLCTDSLGAKRI
jgi:hypothetical protein